MEKYLTPAPSLPPLPAPRCTTLSSMRRRGEARRGRGDGSGTSRQGRDGGFKTDTPRSYLRVGGGGVAAPASAGRPLHRASLRCPGFGGGGQGAERRGRCRRWRLPCQAPCWLVWCPSRGDDAALPKVRSAALGRRLRALLGSLRRGVAMAALGHAPALVLRRWGEQPGAGAALPWVQPPREGLGCRSRATGPDPKEPFGSA